MTSINVRINTDSYKVLKTLSKEKGQSMQETIDQALEQLRRQRFLEATNEAFSALKENADLWNDELEERQIWEQTLTDGI